jgi:hypothetical protein
MPITTIIITPVMIAPVFTRVSTIMASMIALIMVSIRLNIAAAQTDRQHTQNE